MTERTWEDHWREQHIPWDAGAPAPALVDWLARSAPRKGGRALVPGCGSGYDVLALAQAGYQATGLDLAPSARPHFENLRREARLTQEEAQLVVADFFTWKPAERFDLVWDYTFYCAIDPALRPAWKQRMLELLAPDGQLVTLVFPIRAGSPDDGPPYPQDPEEVRRRLEPDFTCAAFDPEPRSHPGREGKEWLGVWERLKQR